MIGYDASAPSSLGSDLGLDVPSWAQPAVDAGKAALAPAEAALLKQYEKQVASYAPWLEGQGRRAVRLAAAKIVPLFAPAPPASGDAPPAGPSTTERLYKPVLDPVLRGAQDEATKIAKPLIAKVFVGLAAFSAAAVLLGRLTKRCR